MYEIIFIYLLRIKMFSYPNLDFFVFLKLSGRGHDTWA